jgi:fructokinase
VRRRCTSARSGSSSNRRRQRSSRSWRQSSDEVLVLADPNCRPAAIDDPVAYRARLTGILRRADVVKVSEEDLAWLSPGLPWSEAADALQAAGPAVVLVTRGADGASVLLRDDRHTIPAPPVRVVDTIGAGDAFGGAFLAWWRRAGLGRRDVVRTAAVLEATRFACLVAARTCEQAGAVPPRLADLDAG